MNANRVRRNQFIEVGELIANFPAVKLDCEFLFDKIEIFYSAQITIKNILVVIIPNLHHSVANAVSSPVTLHRRAGRIERGLQFSVQVFGATNAFVHWCQHLRFQAKLAWHPVTAERFDCRQNFLRVVFVNEKEIAFFRSVQHR